MRFVMGDSEDSIAGGADCSGVEEDVVAICDSQLSLLKDLETASSLLYLVF